MRTFLLLHAASYSHEWVNEWNCLFVTWRKTQILGHLDMSLPILCNVQWWENGGGGSVLCSLFGGSWWCRWREVAWYFCTPFCLSLLSLDIIYGPQKVRGKSTWSVKSDLQGYAWQRWSVYSWILCKHSDKIVTFDLIPTQLQSMIKSVVCVGLQGGQHTINPQFMQVHYCMTSTRMAHGKLPLPPSMEKSFFSGMYVGIVSLIALLSQWHLGNWIFSGRAGYGIQ